MSYKTTLSRTWWLKNTAFKSYMLRELTSVPLLFFVLCLLAGIYSLSQDESAWQHWQAFMTQPWVISLNLVALAASLFHAYTFFQLFPRVMPLRVAGKPVPNLAIVLAQWAGVVGVLVIFALIFGS